MTREAAKLMLPVIQAYAEGKTIQDKIEGVTGWCDTEEINFEYDGQKIIHRIKPEPKYRPFKTQEECWNEMMKHQPFGWIKTPNGDLSCIDKVFDKGITYNHSSYQFSDYIADNYTFIDGTPFGVKIE